MTLSVESLLKPKLETALVQRKLQTFNSNCIVQKQEGFSIIFSWGRSVGGGGRESD